jgi:phosphate transport system protein
MLVQRATLDREIEKVNTNLQRLTSMVDNAVGQAMQALRERDVGLAHQVIQQDEEVNTLRFEIEWECLRIIATQQPAAGDLRHIIAATHIAGELERIGDHASSIADVVERLEAEAPILSLHKLPKMEKQARKMLRQSIEAFFSKDAEGAYDLDRREGKISKHYDALLEESFSRMADYEHIQETIYFLWVGRHLERIGDRALNISERVIFVVTGEFVEID